MTFGLWSVPALSKCRDFLCVCAWEAFWKAPMALWQHHSSSPLKGLKLTMFCRVSITHWHSGDNNEEWVYSVSAEMLPIHSLVFVWLLHKGQCSRHCTGIEKQCLVWQFDWILNDHRAQGNIVYPLRMLSWASTYFSDFPWIACSMLFSAYSRYSPLMSCQMPFWLQNTQHTLTIFIYLNIGWPY